MTLEEFTDGLPLREYNGVKYCVFGGDPPSDVLDALTSDLKSLPIYLITKDGKWYNDFHNRHSQNCKCEMHGFTVEYDDQEVDINAPGMAEFLRAQHADRYNYVIFLYEERMNGYLVELHRLPDECVEELQSSR